MTNFKKIFHLMESIDPTYRNYLLNEISIIDKYNKEKEKNNYIGKGIDYDTFEELCNIDPTTKGNNIGKYCNWLIAKYNPNTNFNELKRCLEWFADGIKRNILSRYNISSDINSFKTYEEFINTMNSLNDNNDDLNISSSEYNNRKKLEGQFEVLGSNRSYDIITPKTFEAERYFGGNTEWCTVANNDYFSEYMKEGPLYILYPKNGNSEYKMQFHFESNSFGDKYDKVDETPVECIERVVKDKGVCNELISLCKKVFVKTLKYLKYFLSFEELVEIILPKLENGENPKELFNYVGYFEEGLATVELKNKWNFINTKNKILFPNLWFDFVENFNEGFAQIFIEGQGYNFINTDREYLRDDLWFEDAWEFKDGYAAVKIKDRGWNWIKTDGEILFDDLWFDYTYNFYEGYAGVYKEEQGWNFIKTDGKILRDNLWFDEIKNFNEEFAAVKIKDKGWNFIKTDGKILRDDLWFGEVSIFWRGFARVRIKSGSDYKDYKIDTNGILYDDKGNRVDLPVQESKKYNNNNNTNNINNMKRRIRLTENDLHNIIKESVKKVLNEDYDLNSDFEDGGSIYDRDTFGKNEDELENYYRSQKLGDKHYQNQEYEALRYRKMNGGNYEFIQNMEDKLKKIFPKYDPEKLHQSYTTSTNNALDSINDMRSDIAIMVRLYKDAYNKTGDERFLMAAKSEMRSLRDIIEDKINRLNRNPHVKINLSIDFMDEKLKNYSPLSKDKVYDYDGETKTYSSRLANISDRKNGYNG